MELSRMQITSDAAQDDAVGQLGICIIYQSIILPGGAHVHNPNELIFVQSY